MLELFVDSIQKSFGHHRILTDVFISCKPGEIIGLLGRNGAGKSTLLKIIFGSTRADNRFVRIDGKNCTRLSDRQGSLNYLPQDNFLPSHLKVKTAIDLFCEKSQRELIKREPHVEPFLDRKTNQLSGGERRLIEIEFMMHSSSRYTLIDEPFNGVEPLHKEDVKSLIQKHSKEKGLIITDHDHKNILNLATRLILLHDGRTREIKNKDELVFYGYLPSHGN
jgi:ABC-type multidrug transport system ATPase subunit